MSSPRLIEFVTDPRFVRRQRELKTIAVMLDMYCRAHHHPLRQGLCDECSALLDYAGRRLQRCVFGDAKPTCNHCVVHCYSADLRERMRLVMRWAGPRMLLRHPVLGLMHLHDGRRPVPRLPEKPRSPVKTATDPG